MNPTSSQAIVKNMGTVSKNGEAVLTEALKLPPIERAELVERILASFTFADRGSIDAAWGAEVEERIDAYERGEMTGRPASEVFERINRTHP